MKTAIMNSAIEKSTIMKSTSEKYCLFAPGPVQIHPEVQKILADPMIHHRTPLFDAILKRVLVNIKGVFDTRSDVVMLSATGSGGMEAAVVNFVSPGDKVLCIVSGKFGERWQEMLQRYGCEVIAYAVPWGESADVEEVKKLLEAHQDLRALYTQACETSTGALHPLAAIGKLLNGQSKVNNQASPLFIVDGITAVGAFPVKMDEWSIDVLVAGSQKAFMLPTGMSFVGLSARAQQAYGKGFRFYFDLEKEIKANKKGETFFSSNVSLIKALDVVLEMWSRQGLADHYAEIAKRAQWTRELAARLGLPIFPKQPSDSLTVLRMPEGMDSQALRNWLEKEKNITVIGGQDELKGKVIRIGHMGHLQPLDQWQLLGSFYEALENFGYRPPETLASLREWTAEYLQIEPPAVSDSKVST